MPPVTASLPADLAAVQARWRATPKREDQDRLYAAEFAVPFARLFSALPLHGAAPDVSRPRVLVSLLGYSWQPVALMAAWVRPSHLLVLGTPESLAQPLPDDEPLKRLIGRVADLDVAAIDVDEVSDSDEVDIYRKVFHFLRRHDALGEGRPRAAIDPTGGKKSMTAAAALAGFLTHSLLLYVDYAEYDRHGRIPIAGTEYPRLLTNPLAVLGELELERVRRAFNAGDYRQAETDAARLAAQMENAREPECLVALAHGYGAWEQFQFSEARARLSTAADLLAAFGRWPWASGAHDTVNAHVGLLGELEAAARTPQPASFELGAPAILNHLACARRHRARGRHNEATLLTYAALERFVDLRLWTGFGLADEEPAYDRLAAVGFDERLYHDVGRRLVGERDYAPRPPEGSLTFIRGVQMLATLEPWLIGPDDFGELRGLANVRNRSPFEHGLVPRVANPKDVDRFLDRVTLIVARATTSGDVARLHGRVQAYDFPIL